LLDIRQTILRLCRRAPISENFRRVRRHGFIDSIGG
jgi:hypothetical protein